jgi:CTD small phosphatase-like protein 2
MATTLIRVSLRASRGSSAFAATRLLSTVAYNYARTVQPTKPSLVLGGSTPRINGTNGSTPQTNGANGSTPPRVNGVCVQEYHKPKSDLVVVLDMDECLIHSQFFSPHAARLAHQLPHNHASSWNYSTSSSSKRVESFRFTLPDGDVVHVNKRPHLKTFLQHVCSRFETHIFTAAMEVYAAPVLDHLDPTGTMFAQRWYREHCLYQDGAYVKDLSALAKPPHRTVLVDNNPLSFLANPENGILVNNFYNDPDDTTLFAVLDLLDELDQSKDVRPLLVERFGLKEALEEVGNEQPQAVASN